MTFFGDCKIHAILLTGEKNIEIIEKIKDTLRQIFCFFVAFFLISEEGMT